MQLGFFCVFRRDPQPYALAARLIASVRASLPGVPITQFTDATSPACDGIDHVRRGPDGPMLEQRMEHYARCAGDWLLVDTDVEIKTNVSCVFPTTPFDLALADRHWPGVPQGDDVMHTMPFNTGVVFCRNPLFWEYTLKIWHTYPADRRDWMSEQRAVYDVVRSGRFLVQILPGQTYNYPPRRADDPCADAAIVHWKGARKAWYLSRPAVSSDATREVAASVHG